MKRTLLCIAIMAGLLATNGLADEKDRKGDRRKDRREAARKSTSANQPRREGRRTRQAANKNKGKARTDVLIYQFKHIHVDSFIGTLEQLARSKHVAPHLKDVPHAVNEQSNTMVMLAPPELTRLVRQIAEGVDKPNPREMGRKKDGPKRHRSTGQRECPMMKRSGGGKPPRPGRDKGDDKQARQCPRCRKGKEQCKRDGKCPMGKSRSQMKEHGRQGSDRPVGRRGSQGERGAKGEEARRPMMVGMLLHPRLAGAIKLDEKQVDKIRDVVKDLHGKMEQLSKRVGNARKDARSEKARSQLQTNARRRIMQLHKEAREKIDKILTDEQKEQWRKMSKAIRPHLRGHDGDRRANRRNRRDDDDDDDDDEDDDEDDD